MKPGRPQKEHRLTRSRHGHAPYLKSITAISNSRIIHAVKPLQSGHEIRLRPAIPASLTLQEISQRGLRVSPHQERIPAETISRPVQSRIPDPVPHPRHNSHGLPYIPIHHCVSMTAPIIARPAATPARRRVAPPSPRQTTRRHQQASGSCYNGKHEHHERHSQGQQA